MIWAVVILAGATLSGAFAENGTPAKVVVGTSFPGIESMPIYVAREQGFFRDEQIAVDLIYLNTGDKLAFALLGGSIDIARYTPDWTIRAIERGGSKLKIVLGGNNAMMFSLVARADVRGYSDLKGKRIGVSTLAAADATLVKKMLAAHGLAPSDYELIQAGSSPERAAALRAGSLSAAMLLPPADQKVLDDGGARRIDASTSIISHYAWGGEAVREDWARTNRAALLSYMRAWIRATRWVHDASNRNSVIRLLAREARIEDRYAGMMYDIYLGPNGLPVPKDGELDLAGFQALLQDMTEQSQIGPPVPSPEKYLDRSYWEEVERSLH